MNALEKTKARREKFALYFVGSGAEWAAVIVENPLPVYGHDHDYEGNAIECMKCNRGERHV